MVEGIDWSEVEREADAVADTFNDDEDYATLKAQLDRIETKLDEVLTFRDLILTTAAPFLTGGKSKIWLALLAKGKGTDRT